MQGPNKNFLWDICIIFYFFKFPSTENILCLQRGTIMNNNEFLLLSINQFKIQKYTIIDPCYPLENFMFGNSINCEDTH